MTLSWDSLRAAVAPRLGIDPRALAAFRILLGAVVLANLALYRLPALDTFYTDSGVFPRTALAETHPLFESLSLHALSGALWVQLLLLAITGSAAVAMILGYRTTIATGISAILLASLYARNPFVLNGGDSILLTFLFFALFLPLDERWSLSTSPRSDTTSPVVSLATALFLIHFTTIYATNAILKYQSDAWMTGAAVPRIFHVQEYIVLLGPYVADQTALLTAVNWMWIGLLTLAPFLLLLTGWSRAGLAAAFITAQLGMAVTMRLGVFPHVMITALLVFFPPQVWDHVERGVRTLGLETTLRERVAHSQLLPPTSPQGTLTHLRQRGRSIGTVILVCGFTACFLWQAVGTGLVEAPADNLDGELSNAGWSFFAPHPPSTSGWYVVEADLGAETKTTTVDGRELTADRPPDAADMYPSTLWNRYGADLQRADETHYDPVGTYICTRMDEDVVSITLYYVEQSVTPTGPTGEPTRYERTTHTCASR